MITPAGKECKYFYGDYHRGRDREECRLLENADPPQRWRPSLCSNCPAPDILKANSCENMHLNAQVERPLFILKPRVVISTYCVKSNQKVREPQVGCGQCHSLPEFFIGEPNDPDPAG